MHTSERLFIAGGAVLGALDADVTKVEIDWGAVFRMRDALQRSWFPRSRNLRGLEEQMPHAIGVIELEGRDMHFQTAPPNTFFQPASAVGYRNGGDGEARISDLVTAKSRLGIGPVLEIVIPSWEDEELQAGVAVGGGILKAAGIWRPEPDPTDLVATRIGLALTDMQHQFLDVLDIEYA